MGYIGISMEPPQEPPERVLRRSIFKPNKAYLLAQKLSRAESERLARFCGDAIRFERTPVGDTEVSLLELRCNYDESPVLEGKAPIRTSTTVLTPKDHQLGLKLMRLRILMSDGENSFFYRNINLLSKAMHSLGVTEPLLDGWKRGWAIPQVRSFGAPLDGDALLNLWFNSEHFHRDREKARELAEIAARYHPARVRAWLMLAVGFKHAVVHELLAWLRAGTDLFVQWERVFPMVESQTDE